MYAAYLVFSCQELFNGGLRFVVVLLACSGIDFSCVYTGGAIQQYGLREYHTIRHDDLPPPITSVAGTKFPSAFKHMMNGV